MLNSEDLDLPDSKPVTYIKGYVLQDFVCEKSGNNNNCPLFGSPFSDVFHQITPQ
jgi:hypothetical protein